MEPDADAGLDGTPAAIPIGRAGRLEAVPLSAAGDHAVLVQETAPHRQRRALLTTDKLASGERLVLMPLDEEVEVRVDGDALAVWLGSGSIQQLPPDQRPIQPGSAPAWATLVGGALLLIVLAFAVIGSAVAFSWLLEVLG